MGWFPCCCCQCVLCQDGSAPCEIQVDISGIVNNVPPNCLDCDDLNGSFICKLDPNVSGICRWEYQFDTQICQVNYVRVELSLTPQNKVRLDVRLEHPGTVINWYKVFDGETIDCHALDAEPIDTLQWYDQCDPAGAEVTVTAL